MVPHHQGASAIAKGKQGALRAMAEDIISAQTSEIVQMKQWHEDWYGSRKALLDMDGHGSASNVGTGG